MRGATTEEIARKQGVTETAIRIRLLRARRAARSRVEKRAARIREHYRAARACAGPELVENRPGAGYGPC